MLTGNEYAVVGMVIVAAVAMINVVFLWPSGSASVPRPRRFYRNRYRFQYARVPDLRDAEQQLNVVMAASFQKQRLLNRGEFWVFKVIEGDIAAAGRGYRVFAQTNLGEILRSPGNDDAFHSINSKRVDILIVDRESMPVVAVEYQGGGHYQGTATVRDAIKNQALRKAGVRYVEVWPNDSADQIRSRVREQLGWPSEPTPDSEGATSLTTPSIWRVLGAWPVRSRPSARELLSRQGPQRSCTRCYADQAVYGDMMSRQPLAPSCRRSRPRYEYH
jgi:hypothetical protein